MRGNHIRISKRQIIADHLQRRVTEQALKREHVAIIPQVFNGKSMTERMRMGRHASATRQFRLRPTLNAPLLNHPLNPGKIISVHSYLHYVTNYKRERSQFVCNP